MNLPERIRSFFAENAETVSVFLLLLAQLLFIFFSDYIGFYHLLFLFFFFNIVLVPGYLLSRTLFGDLPLPVLALLSFVSGTAVAFVVLIVFTLFRLNIFFLGIFMPVISLILTFLRRTGRSEGIFSELRQFDLPVISRPVKIILLLLLLSVVILIISSGDPLLYTSDSADHIAYIRRVSESGRVFPDRYLYREGGMLTRDIRKGLYHGAWGAANLLTGYTDVAAIWPLIAAISSVFIILAIFSAGVFIFRRPGTGLLAAFIFVLIHGGGLTSYRLITAAFSYPLGRVFSIVFLFSVLGYFSSGRKTYLFLMGLASLAATGTHIGHFIVALFLIFVLVAGKLIESPSRVRKTVIKRTAPLIAAITVGVNLPYLLIRYLRDYAPNNPIHTHLQGIFRISDNLYTINPVVIFQQAGLLSILGIISVFVLWRQSRQETNLRLLLWGEIAVWGLLFNPFLIPLALKMISYLVMRLKLAFPVTLIPAVLIMRILDRLKGYRSSISPVRAFIGGAAAVVIIGYQLAVTPSDFAYSAGTGLSPGRSCRNISDIFSRINSAIPAGSIVASDPMTSYCLPAFTDQFVVCTNGQHSIPNDSTALQRIMDCRDIFLPACPISDVAEILERYNVDYIVVNGRIPVTIGTLYWKPDGEMAAKVISRFSDYPEYFELIYNHRVAAIFRVTDEISSVVEQDRFAENKFTGRRVTPRGLSSMTPSEFPGIYINSVNIDKRRVERGSELELNIEWTASGKCDYGSYVSHIRFDTGFEKGVLYHKWYGKIYRKVLEKIEGRMFRFRRDHLPLDGIYPPDRWPPMRIIKDSMIVDIPEYVAAGEYTISVRMAERTQYPNYSLRDLLMDDDYFDGPDVGKVIIE